MEKFRKIYRRVDRRALVVGRRSPPPVASLSSFDAAFSGDIVRSAVPFRRSLALRRVGATIKNAAFRRTKRGVEKRSKRLR